MRKYQAFTKEFSALQKWIGHGGEGKTMELSQIVD